MRASGRTEQGRRAGRGKRWALRGWALRLVAAILRAPIVGARLRRWIARRTLRVPLSAIDLLPSAAAPGGMVPGRTAMARAGAA